MGPIDDLNTTDYFLHRPTDRPTNRPTDRPTDQPTDRQTYTHEYIHIYVGRQTDRYKYIRIRGRKDEREEKCDNIVTTIDDSEDRIRMDQVIDDHRCSRNQIIDGHHPSRHQMIDSHRPSRNHITNTSILWY
ncbi:hypothetical protein DINM_003785 [Dirofilaria immitis]|nr:hypothetical protein [Dirofilaria immitis]